MKKVFIFLLCIGMLVWGGNAIATPVSFNVDDFDNGYSSFVALSDISTLGWTSISASLAELDSVPDFDLDEFESTSFDFFTFSVTGIGIGSFSLSSNLYFETPEINIAGAGSGGWGTFGGIFSGGFFRWQDRVQTFSLSLTDGTTTSVSIALDDGFALVAGSQVTVQATVTNLGGGTAAAPVPEPATIFLSGLGLMSMGAYLRKRKTKKA